MSQYLLVFKTHAAARRWALKRHEWALYLVQELLVTGTRLWREYGNYLTVGFDKRYRGFGMEHTYYDGPNCVLNLGFFFIAWSFGRCKKCELDRTE